MITRSLRVAFVALTVLTLSTVIVAKEDNEGRLDGTVRFTGKSAAAGVGWTWGDGTLTYKGKNYPVEVDGLTVGSVGAASIEATGQIYDLGKLSDFDGTYTAASAGATVGGGMGTLVMKNQHGVSIHMRATTEGIKLTAGVSGIKLHLKQ